MGILDHIRLFGAEPDEPEPEPEIEIWTAHVKRGKRGFLHIILHDPTGKARFISTPPKSRDRAEVKPVLKELTNIRIVPSTDESLS